MSDRSTWFIERRLDYIDWQLSITGRIGRADLVRTFGVRASQASLDLNEYLRRHPDAMTYDRTLKVYVAAKVPARLRGGARLALVEAAAGLAKEKAGPAD